MSIDFFCNTKGRELLTFVEREQLCINLSTNNKKYVFLLKNLNCKESSEKRVALFEFLKYIGYLEKEKLLIFEKIFFSKVFFKIKIDFGYDPINNRFKIYMKIGGYINYNESMAIIRFFSKYFGTSIIGLKDIRNLNTIAIDFYKNKKYDFKYYFDYDFRNLCFINNNISKLIILDSESGRKKYIIRFNKKEISFKVFKNIIKDYIKSERIDIEDENLFFIEEYSYDLSLGLGEIYGTYHT